MCSITHWRGKGAKVFGNFCIRLFLNLRNYLRQNPCTQTSLRKGIMFVRQEMRKNGMLVDIFRIHDGFLQEHWDAFRFSPDARIIPGF